MDKNIENVESVKSFNNELSSLYECKPPISKAKMVQLTKLAMKAIKYYKHIVMSVEKFIQKCRPEYKLPGLYVVDSIVRQSRHQYGTDKDVFAPRFSKNISVTFQALFKCPEEDKIRIVRVIKLWLKNGVFPEEDLKPLLDLAAGLGIDINEGATTERNGKGDSTTRKMANTPSPLEKSPTLVMEYKSNSGDRSAGANLDPGVFSQLQKLTTTIANTQQQSDQRLTQKILADYEYSDEESGGEEASESQQHHAPEMPRHDMSANLAAAAQNLLKNPDLLKQIHQMQQSMKGGSTTTLQLSHHHQSGVGGSENFQNRFQHPPPPVVLNVQQPPPNIHALTAGGHRFVAPPSSLSPPPQAPFVRGYENQSSNYPPPAEPLPPDTSSSGSPLPFGRTHWPTNPASERLLDRDERKRGSESSKRRSRSRSKERRRRGSRSRSRSGERSGRRRNRSRSGERRNRDHDRERKKQGLPPMKSKHVSICSRTLWFGRMPSYCETREIKDGLKDYGEPVSVDFIQSRGCAYVVMADRKSAYKVLDRLKESLKIQGRLVKMAWAPGKGVKEYKNGWMVEHGVTYLPWDCLPNDLTALLDGGSLDTDSLPDNLKGSYSESGKLVATEATSTIPVIQSNFSIAPPSFTALTGFPAGLPQNLFAAGLPPGFPPPSMVPAPVPPPDFSSAAGAPLHAGPMSSITGLPPPLPSSMSSLLRTQMPTNVTSMMGDTNVGQSMPPSLMALYGQAPFGHPPGVTPNYAHPISMGESGGYGHAGFYQTNRGGDVGGFDHAQNRGGNFDQHSPNFRGGRGRGRGDFGGRGRGYYRGGRGGGDGGHMGRRDFSHAPQSSQRFDAAIRNSRSMWSGGSGDEQPTQFIQETPHERPRRSRWAPSENENFPNNDNADISASMENSSIPVISSMARHEESNEPPPPGE